MNTQLIQVVVGTRSNETSLLCNAGDLHQFLGVGKVFYAWIKARIAEYRFIENQDFLAMLQSRKIGQSHPLKKSLKMNMRL